MQDPLDPSTIIFALIAIFVLWKLGTVLGTRTGREKPPTAGPFSRSKLSSDNKIVPLPGAAPRPVTNPPPSLGRWSAYAEPGSKVAAGLDAIAAADPSFNIETFMSGAKAAYEMIVTAYAACDRQTLRNLLDKDVFDSFTAAIAARESRGDSMTTTVVSVNPITINDAQVRNRMLQITLRFVSKLVTATRDKAGVCIEGSPDRIVDMVDIWTFARDAAAADPNWKLIATQTGH